MFVSHVQQRRVDTPVAFLQAVDPYAGTVALQVTSATGAMTLDVPGPPTEAGSGQHAP